MHFQVFVPFCLLLVQSVLCNEQAEHDPVLSYLNIHPDTVEKHELARFEINEEDDRAKIGFRIFGYDTNIWLHPVDSYLFSDETPVYKATGWQDGRVRYELMSGIMKKVGRLYENQKHLASVVIGADTDGSTVNGHIILRGDNLMIRSVPEHVAQQYLRKRRSTETPIERNPNVAYHVALKLKEPISSNNLTYGDALPMRQRRQINPMQKPVEIDFGPIYPDRSPNTLYPEILLVVDSSYTSEWRRSDTQLLAFMEYLMAFWNGVDLIYRGIEDPRIRFNIATVILSINSEATPYVHNNKNANTVNPFHALGEATIYWGKYPTFEGREYDVTVILTRLTLGHKTQGSQTIGLSHGNSTCRRNYPVYVRTRGNIETYVEKPAPSQALVHDNGAFFGIPVAAHELAHILGAEHDNNFTDPRCHFQRGFLMAATKDATGNSHSMSICTLYQIQGSLRREELSCLNNPPVKKGRKLPLLMPGKIASLDEQCRALSESGTYTRSCNLERQIDACIQIWCENTSGECLQTTSAAADGTWCPDPNGSISGFCLQNRCMAL